MVGYFTVPLVSLANRRQWPDEVRFAVALGVAALGALAISLVRSQADQFLPMFSTLFAAQQITWHLRIPGAGSATVNNALERVGESPRRSRRGG